MIYTIHGWSFGKNIWISNKLKNAYHLELPGHGTSDSTETDIGEIAKLFAKKIEYNSTIVSWSLGATVSLLMAYFYPEKLEKLIIFSPTPSFCKVSQNKIVCRNFIRKLKRDFGNTVKWFLKECDVSYRVETGINNEELAVSLLESYMNIDIYSVLPQINLPVEIYCGENDKVTKLKGALETFRLLKNSTLKIYPRKGHYLFDMELL